MTEATLANVTVKVKLLIGYILSTQINHTNANIEARILATKSSKHNTLQVATKTKQNLTVAVVVVVDFAHPLVFFSWFGIFASGLIIVQISDKLAAKTAHKQI